MRSLAFDEWPERDRFAWTEAIAEGDIFNGRSPAAPWAPTVRPKFTGADRNDRIWDSTKGRPLTPNAIARIITERNRDAFGEPVNPHLFRHCAATTIAILQLGRRDRSSQWRFIRASEPLPSYTKRLSLTGRGVSDKCQ